MRVVHSAEEAITAYDMAKSEAKKPLAMMKYILKNICKIRNTSKYRLSAIPTAI